MDKGVDVVIPVADATTNCVELVTLRMVVFMLADAFSTDIPALSPVVLLMVMVVPDTADGVNGDPDTGEK
jgi:hypothetical protein